jgi:uncharacterized protein YecE (DUF72 family)
MMSGVSGTLYLGTSGFAYDEWKHCAFYPEGMSAGGMLAHYASVFGSVEINYTFRRFPSEKTLTGWSEQTPEGFRFALKANQRITHTRRLREAGNEVRAFVELSRTLGDRLGPILFQCPPNLKFDEGLIRAFANDLPPGVSAAMEFRHPSWDEAWPLLAERGIARCVADTDERKAAEDALSWQPFGYLRLRRAEYSDSELEIWAGRIRAALDGGSDVYCYFKHEDSAAGPRMALRLRAMTERGAEDRSPPAPP